MRYYFFKTAMIDRGNGPQPTLRALPGQKFPDGTPVDTSINVRAPKEAGSSTNGCRLEYPDGTVFCSTFLDTVTTSTGKAFYTVYADANDPNPDFHPVADSPSFKYVDKRHESKSMNVAYVSFITFGDQTDGEEEAPVAAAKSSAPAVRYAPYDKDMKAIGPVDGWQPAYEDQVQTEAELVASWMRRYLNDLAVRTPARRPKVDAENATKFDLLFRCGETADSIASRKRFMKIYTAQKMDVQGLSMIGKGPLNWYLDLLVEEHTKGLETTFEARSADSDPDVRDAAFIVTSEINRQLGNTDSSDDPKLLEDMKKAIDAGWTLDEMLCPERLTAKQNAQLFAAALATGDIPLPEKNETVTGKTLIDSLLKNPKFACPKDKDGFHVDPLTWKILVLNFHMKTNTLLFGPTGSGKTQLVQKLCAQTGTPLTIIPMGSITDPTEQLVGKMDLDPSTNGTKFDWADFALAIQRPGVVLLDEINRIPKNGYNILFNVLDDTRVLVASGAKSTDKRTIQVNPDCIFFATANMGDEYTGTAPLDEAMKNRFFEHPLDYLDTKTESAILVKRTGVTKEDATNIALIAKNIRDSWKSGTLQHSVSTRETLRCAQFVKSGFPVEEALEVCFLPKFEAGLSDNDPKCERGTVKAMIATRFNNKK